MRILVTGGTGFIGRALCRELSTAGHRLLVLSRRPQRVPLLCGHGAAAVDKLDHLAPEESFDAVVNLAGEPIVGRRWTAARKRALWDSRIGLTEQLVDCIARSKTKPSVLLSGSAVGYYGDQGDRLLDESSPAMADDFGHRLCAAWEAAADKARGLDVRVCILRTGLVLGPGGGLLQRMLPPFRLGLGGTLGSGTQWMSWIHLHDHVRAMITLMESPELSGTFNLTAPNPVTNREFTACLAGKLHRSALLPLPSRLLKLLFGEMADLLLGGQRVVPRRLTEAGFRFRYDSLESALDDALAPGPRSGAVS